MKIVTFSFDDNVTDDIRLIELFDRYGLKATFNLNSGSLSSNLGWQYAGIKDVKRINYFDNPDLYKNHEVACHGYTHPRLEQLDEGTMDNEIRLDKKILEFLYDCKIHGMAYPYGSYSESVLKALENNQIEYCRTVAATHDFIVPENPLLWHPTCHFKDATLMDLAEKFVNSANDQDLLFYVWGHSHELVTEEEWDAFERFCKYISHRDDICYCTNIEALNCINAQAI